MNLPMIAKHTIERVQYTILSHENGVEIHSSSFYKFLTWEEVSDVEILSELCSDWRVCVFKDLVEDLGKAHRNHGAEVLNKMMGLE